MPTQHEQELKTAKQEGRREVLWIMGILVLVEIIGGSYLW